jgi:acetylornithine deacetylase/succinyl-diaminopimelate desuccinylase-like protein
MLPTDFLTHLAVFVAHPGVSTDPTADADTVATATWLENWLRARHFTVHRWEGPGMHPVLCAATTPRLSAPTILVYGHYDVQPVDAGDAWHADPFTLHKTDGRLFARGVADNKGQLLIHLWTVADLMRRGGLRYNVKFLIEGDEECGSPGLADTIARHRDALACDHILISDGAIIGDTPTIEASLRGNVNLTLTYKTADSALHSGAYGGAVPNAAYELGALIGKFYDADHVIAIPGFYKGMAKISAPRARSNRLRAQENTLLEALGVRGLVTEPHTDFYTQTGQLPTIQVTGLSAGYTGDGYANIVPHQATAKLNVRLVAGQQPEAVVAALAQFIAKHTPDYVTHILEKTDSEPGIRVDTDQPLVKKIKTYLADSHGAKPLIHHCGGSIPIVGDMQRLLGVDPILVSLANEDCRMHGVNENFRIDLIDKGLAFSRRLFGRENRLVFR